MKKKVLGGRIISLLLVLAMVLSIAPVSVFAAVGDLSNVSTGLTGDIDTADTISLPIRILDYEADGMLFEYAEAYAGVSGVAAAKTASDFGATWYEDYTTRTDVGGSINTGNYWSDVTLALKTGTYANYTRATWAGNTTANWTGNRAGVVLADFSESSTYTTDQVRYMVVVFRSNVRSGNFTVGLNRANLNGAGTSGNYTGNIAVTTENNTNWTYAVLDLQTDTLGSNWSKGAVYGVYVGLPIDASGEWIDLAHVAFFSKKDQAVAFGEYALTDGSDRGDNRGFGLLRSSRNQSGGDNYAGIIDETTTVEQLNTYGDTTAIDFSTLTTLGYTLLGTFADNGIANVGLLESGLSAEEYPVYKQEVVTYVAKLLKHSLEIPERTSDGWKNYRYVKGTASAVYGNTDLATALRTKINGTMGSYAAASGKDLVGTWSEVGGNIASYYDAAYFLLNSIFVPGSYNKAQTDYNYLVLSAGTDSDTGDKVYVFDGGFTTSATPASASMAIKYDATNGTIQNTSAAGKTHFVYEGTSTTTLNPFLPVISKNTAVGMTKNPYYQDDGVINGVKKQTTKDTLYKRNFGFAIVSEGNFVYHADDELFFEFEGDDDVYLFINGELVMDIGSAHSIDGVRFELNDYVNAAKASNLGSDARNKALALEEGQVYDFKFYYMERHSYGSNIRISTNIRVTDPAMKTEKLAYQDGTQIDFGGIVDKDKVVEYSFAISNPVENGEEPLVNLTFTDNDIGVTLTHDGGLEVTGERVFDLNGGTLDVSDLKAYLYDEDGNELCEYAITNDNDLKSVLTDPGNYAQKDENIGLKVGQKLVIRGIGYKLSDAQIKAGVFDNTVLTTAKGLNSKKTLNSQAVMRVFVPADPMYYQWAGKDLVVSKEKLITDVLAAANQSDNILSGKVSSLTTDNVNEIELVTKAGTAISSDYVTIDSYYDLKIHYDMAGSHVFHVKVTYNSSKNTVIVPVLVNTTDVADRYIVLDYGLPVDIDMKTLLDGDAVTVPGRDTSTSIMAIGTSEPSYEPNTIGFTAETDNTIEGMYGTFTLADNTLTYTPTSFIENEDTIWIAVNVYERDFIPTALSDEAGQLDGININDEVQMYKKVTILPATVMYYEEDFDSITYSTAATIETFSDNSDYKQSADQDEEYGSDSVTYDKGLNSVSSAGSYKKIEIKNDSELASFTFTGTGFELIARTDAESSGTIFVEGGKADTAPTSESDGTEEDEANTSSVHLLDVEITRVASPYSLFSDDNSLTSFAGDTWTIPVIMEFDNGANGGDEVINQVPVIRHDGMDFGTYKVTIKGIPKRDYSDNNAKIVASYLYLDGVRIYEPIGKTNPNYPATENGAEFIEIRDRIAAGDVGAVQYSVDGNLLISSGTTTWAENYSGKYGEEVAKSTTTYTSYEANSVDDYLFRGPNNEVYMIGEGTESAIVFYVSDDGAAQLAALAAEDGIAVAAESAHSLQIALRAVDLASAFGAGASFLNASIQYGIVADGVYKWTPLVTAVSGTEQYYTIDYTKCPYDGTKEAYQIAVRVNSGMVSFSSLKLVGLTLVELDSKFENATLSYKNGVLTNSTTGKSVDESNLFSLASISSQMSSTTIAPLPTNVVIPKPYEPIIFPEKEVIIPGGAGGNDDNEDEDSKDDLWKDDSRDKPDFSGVPILNLLSLTVTSGEGGSINTEGNLIIAFGASRTFTITPDEGYEVADVLVNGVSVGAVEKYTFRGASQNTTIEAIFRKAETTDK